MTNYSPSIQVLRGILFLFILAFHCGVPYANFGWGGVEAFFVISSFFLVRKYWGSSLIDVKKQFKHRVARLYPPYIAVILVAVLYALMTKVIPYDVITHLLSAQNFQWMVTGYNSAMQPMTAHTWTLSIEVWGGFVWLLLLKRLSKEKFKSAMFVMLSVGIGYRVATVLAGADVWVVSLCPIAHFDAFACGSLLAIGVKEERINYKVGLLSIAGVIGIIGCILLIGNKENVSFLQAYQLLSCSKNYLNNWITANIYVFISLFTTGIVGVMYFHDLKAIDKNGNIEKAFVKLGNNSYTFYLFHWPILVVLKHLINYWWVLFLGAFIITFIAMLVFNRLYTHMQKRFLEGN